MFASIIDQLHQSVKRKQYFFPNPSNIQRGSTTFQLMKDSRSPIGLLPCPLLLYVDRIYNIPVVDIYSVKLIHLQAWQELPY